MSMVMFGMVLRTRRPLPAGVNHADESHHSFILMTQDMAVKDELAGDVLVEAHEQAHLTRRHRIIRRSIRIRQSHWYVDCVQHPALGELVVTFQHAEMQLMNVKVVLGALLQSETRVCVSNARAGKFRAFGWHWKFPVLFHGCMRSLSEP
jgi:hypothetical protein